MFCYFLDVFSSFLFSENASYYAELDARHKELVGETVEIGIMFASKAFVQLLVNPIVGILTHRIGYSIPMFCGFIIMFVSTISVYIFSSFSFFAQCN